MIYSIKMPENGSLNQLYQSINRNKRALLKGAIAVGGTLLTAALISKNMDHTAQTTSSALAAIPELFFETCFTQRCANTQNLRYVLMESSDFKTIFNAANVEDISTHSTYGVDKEKLEKSLLYNLQVEEKIENSDSLLKLMDLKMSNDLCFNSNELRTVLYTRRSKERFHLVKKIADAQLNHSCKDEQTSKIAEILVKESLQLGDFAFKTLLADKNYHQAVAATVTESIKLQSSDTLIKYGISPSAARDTLNMIKKYALNYKDHSEIFESIYEVISTFKRPDILAELIKEDADFYKAIKDRLSDKDLNIVQDLLVTSLEVVDEDVVVDENNNLPFLL